MFFAAQSKQEVLLTAVYRFRTSTHLLLDSVGRWQPQAGLSLQQAFWDGPSDLQGHLLHFTAIRVRCMNI